MPFGDTYFAPTKRCHSPFCILTYFGPTAGCVSSFSSSLADFIPIAKDNCVSPYVKNKVTDVFLGRWIKASFTSCQKKPTDGLFYIPLAWVLHVTHPYSEIRKCYSPQEEWQERHPRFTCCRIYPQPHFLLFGYYRQGLAILHDGSKKRSVGTRQTVYDLTIHCLRYQRVMTKGHQVCSAAACVFLVLAWWLCTLD